MPITLKKDEWKVRDPSSGNYRGAAILSTTLPEDAAQIIEDTQNALDAEETRAGQIINDAQNAVDGIEGQSSLIQQKVANAVLNGNNYELIDTAVESWLDAHPEATTTVEDGSLIENKFTDNLKLKAIKDYVTPQMYGAVGDGISDDTSYFVLACNSGFPVYVKNCLINSCNIENCEIYADNMIVGGKITFKSIRLTGSIRVNGGSFELNKTGSQNTYRDETLFYNLRAIIISCQTFLSILGTLTHPRFENLFIIGKCSENVIKLETSTWITDVIIRDSVLGSCDNTIKIVDTSSDFKGIDDIWIVNTVAQRVNPTSTCKFITTNSLGDLAVINSHMYDLLTGDTQIYIIRNTGYENAACSIVCSGMFFNYNEQFVMDSNGNGGRSLLYDIDYEPHDSKGFYKLWKKVRNDTTFTNQANIAGYGVADFFAFTTEKIIGTIYKVGSVYKTNGPEKFIGVNFNTDKLTVGLRDSTETTLALKTYTANEENNYATTKTALDSYGHGHPIFYVPLKKIVIKYGSHYYDAVGNQIDSEIIT